MSDTQEMFVMEEKPDTWKHTQFYLAGPMEYQEGHGIKWRERAENILEDMGVLPKNILSPTDKPSVRHSLPISKEWELQQKYRKAEDWDNLEQIMKDIITTDLRMVDKCDILIANIPEGSRTFGTVHEIIVARNQKKPVILICDDDGINGVSAWLIGLVGHRRIFGSIEESLSYIKDIAENGPTHPKDKKEFVLFNFDKKDSDDN